MSGIITSRTLRIEATQPIKVAILQHKALFRFHFAIHYLSTITIHFILINNTVGFILDRRSAYSNIGFNSYTTKMTPEVKYPKFLFTSELREKYSAK